MTRTRGRLITALLSTLLLLASSASSLCAAQQQAAGVTTDRSFVADGFSAFFPAQPQPLSYADAQKTRPDSYLARAAGGFYYILALSHHAPEWAVSNTALRQRLFDGIQRDTLDDWKKRLKANFIYQREVSQGAHRGREFTVEAPRHSGVARMYLTTKHLYAVIVFHPREAPQPREVEKFLGSFEINEP